MFLGRLVRLETLGRGTFSTPLTIHDMNTLLFLGSLGLQEILVIVLVVLLLFGGKKIPELMRGLGKGVKSFKDGLNGVEDESGKEEKKENESSDK